MAEQVVVVAVGKGHVVRFEHPCEVGSQRGVEQAISQQAAGTEPAFRREVADIGAEIRFPQAAEQFVGIFGGRDHEGADGEATFAFAGNLCGGITSGEVAVQQEIEAGGVAGENLRLPVGQRRAAEGDGVAVTGRVHGQHVLVALYQKDEALLADRLGGTVDAVERAALVEKRVVGGVDVFRGVGGGSSRGVAILSPCPETGQDTCCVVDREDDTSPHGTESVGHEGRGKPYTEVEPGGRQFAVAGGEREEGAEESLLFFG